MRLTAGVAFCVLVVSAIAGGADSAAARAVTHEEIKDALINFMHIVRSNTDKLERHENREKQLGELLKRALGALDKRERAQDAVLENVVKLQTSLEERIKDMDGSLGSIRHMIQEGDAARGTYTVDSIPTQAIIGELVSANSLQSSQIKSSIDSKIDNLYSAVSSKYDDLYSHLKYVRDELQSVTRANAAIADRQVEIVQAMKDGGGRDSGDSNSALAPQLDALGAKLSLGLESISAITLQDSNDNKVIVAELKKSIENIENRLSELSSQVEELNRESKAIGNVEQVLVKTADDVMDTKRRVEHGLFQIRSEVGDYVKASQGSDHNDTTSEKILGVTETILENQAGTVANLSSKVESEISQVWRQIGIMHHLITASGATLDNLQNQTADFVKSSENRMDAMSSKLEGIESSIDLVQENNNFLVGRFSLFTHEFNETRNSLALTTKDLKSVLKHYKLHGVDVSPGPHDIDNSADNNADNKV